MLAAIIQKRFPNQMSDLKQQIQTIEIKKTEDLFEKINSYEGQNKWIFRGQKDYTWGLKTSLDRMFEEYTKTNITKINVEIALIKRFQRESHHYGITNIDYLNIPEWLSIMQHYGSPTRLHDWTHSPWVGLFFAIIDLDKDKDAALWMADWEEIDSKADDTLKTLYKKDYNVMAIDDFIATVGSGDGVVKLNSFKQNQRQIIQQGTFLFPTNIDKTFEDNLDGKFTKGSLKKFKIPYSIKPEIIKKLYRMNISFTTLYPGIEGFSRSLGYLHHIDGIFKLEANIEDYEGYKMKFKDQN